MTEEHHTPHVLPQPTVWPAAMAAGITLIAAGLVTNFLVSAGGAVLFVISVIGWIGDLLAEGVPGEDATTDTDMDTD